MRTNVRGSRIRRRLGRCSIGITSCGGSCRAREVSATGLFLAEKYVPATMALDLAAAVDHDRAAARVASIRHIRTTYAPDDETCFSLFEAPSLETIQQLNDQFQLGYRRVTAVLEIQSSAGAEPIEGAAP
jgi:hypothetical protein